MHVSVQLHPEAARLLHLHPSQSRPGARRGGGGRRSGTQREGADKLPADLASLASLIQPVHPGVEDDDLKTFFMAEVGTAGEADRLIDRLRRSPHVAAAYLKPADEPPDAPM